MEIFSQGDVSYSLIFLSLIYDNLKLLVPFILGGGGVMLDNLDLFLYAFKRVFYLQLVFEPKVYNFTYFET